jgi:hypothetical protein
MPLICARVTSEVPYLYNPLKHNGNNVNTCFNIKEPCILPTLWIYVFHMILTINSDYFFKQH